MQYLHLAIALLSPIVFAYLNRQRGKDSAERVLKIPKIGIYLIFAIITTILTSNWGYADAKSILVSTGVLIAITNGWFWLLSPGWGKWFPHADKDTSGERESTSWFVDAVAPKIVGYKLAADLDAERTIAYKTVAMSLRFFICAIPLAAAAALSTKEWWVAPLVLAAVVPCGYIYRVAFKHANWKKRTIYAEHLVGAWLAMIVLAIYFIC